MVYDTLQGEIILDYYRNPRNKGVLENADAHAHDSNPLCGDELAIFLKLGPDGRIAKATFDGKGCAISQAAAGMLTELLVGKTLEQAARLAKDDILKLLGIDLGPSRMKCALLSLKVAKLAAYGKLGKEMADDPMK
ncbi:MAG: iron-sulfur cluster assembly scaffold protein [Candidatus Aenigmarchaeota archaeon]|nr:iron-sulfur cluster assembly scaffold protein [Candidatus Aenigmarchaeota archaeon]